MARQVNYLKMRISDDDRQLLAMFATALGLSQSAAIRRLIRQAANASGIVIEGDGLPAQVSQGAGQ